MAKQSNPNLLRCLAIQQPWAWAVCVGIKTVENRTISTPHQGLIAILASTKKTKVNELVHAYPDLDLDPEFFEYGAVIGVANLENVVEIDPSLESNLSAFGPLCWMLKDARLLPNPISAKGKLNLYTLDAGESQDVHEQLPNLKLHPLTKEGAVWLGVYRLESLLAKGNWFQQKSRFDDALTRFDEVLRSRPDHIGAICGRAWCLLGKNDATTVIRDCTALLNSDAENTVALMLRREAYLLQGDLEKADADFETASELNPDDVEWWENTYGGEETESEEDQ